MRIKVPTTETEPEDITPFTMVPALVWKAYDGGELTQEMLLTFLVLSHHVNPYEGIGRANYAKICTWLQLSVGKQSINRINKMMMELRDEHELIWFPSHSGSRDFQYLVANYKMGRKTKKETERWVDISQYSKKKKTSDGRGNDEVSPSIPLEVKLRQPPPEQRLESGNNGSPTSIRDILRHHRDRASYTETENDT